MNVGLTEHARASFLRACWLDVAVRKPGNVSVFSPGHRMQAEQFVASARAAAVPLLQPGARVGERIEAALTIMAMQYWYSVVLLLTSANCRKRWKIKALRLSVLSWNGSLLLRYP